MSKPLVCLTLIGLAAAGGCRVPPHLERAPKPHRYGRDPSTGRGFYYYVPSTYRHDRAAPVIVSCHGTPPYDVAQHHVREWKALAERHGCIVLCPELVGTDGILGDGPLAGMFADERYILSLISLFGYRYNIDRANVMITGFSGGGFPTYWVGLRHPDVFSVIAARNSNFSEANTDGWFPDEARRTAVLVYYGSNDPGAIQGQSRNAIRYLRGEGFSVQEKVLRGLGHQRKPEVAMDFFLAHMNEPDPSLPKP
ncbi:MAG: hypothetical protein ACOC8F_01100 [Planctomycetota bacterium]